MKRARLRAVAFACAAAAITAGARGAGAAADQRSAVFALIIGVNASPDPDVPPLQYADDDAARYLDLFRALGARTYLLARLDDNTRRLHAQAAAEAQPPRHDELRRAVAALARDIAQARARGVRSVLYVIYAGHGDVHQATPYLTLEDGRLDGAALINEVVGPPGADQSHVIIDACQAYLLAFQRGPGGVRRPVQGFVELEAAARQGNVGYLLSTSVTGETHEWAGFEAGVFSHEVRSGLYGAADADGDGVVTYAEIAAFVTRANAPIVNDRFRPQIIARAPPGQAALLDLRLRSAREMRFEGSEAAAHYLLEDAQGVRLLDFHGTARLAVHLVRPAVIGPMYLRRLSDGAERTIPPGDDVVHLDKLPVEVPRAQIRGAAHHAFSLTFSLPFDAGAVVAYQGQVEAELHVQQVTSAGAARRARGLRTAGWAAGAASGAAALVAGAFELSALRLHATAAGASQADAAERNADIASRNRTAGVFLIGAGVGLTASAVLLVLGHESPVIAAPTPDGATVVASWNF